MEYLKIIINFVKRIVKLEFLENFLRYFFFKCSFKSIIFLFKYYVLLEKISIYFMFFVLGIVILYNVFMNFTKYNYLNFIDKEFGNERSEKKFFLVVYVFVLYYSI